MTQPREISFQDLNLASLETFEGRLVICITDDGKMDQAGRRVNRLTRGAILRLTESADWSKMKNGDISTLSWPAGTTAKAVDVIKLSRSADAETVRIAGAALAKVAGSDALLIAASPVRRIGQFALGLMLRGYAFTQHKTAEDTPLAAAIMMVSKTEEAQAEYEAMRAIAEGVFFTRDLVAEPANVLTTTEFAARLSAFEELGIQVDVLEEDVLAELKMGALLAVGQGSASPSKVVVMRWNGGERDAAPVALVGKGVVFDTGGISLKPAAGMEEMTMDMGGAGTVAGTMMTLAKRKAPCNVVGVVGLVENMPSGTATRPGDVVTSMKGDTIEVINTDAEGRLVLCDIMWYTQEVYKPVAMIDLATLTGAAIIALGHENAAVYSNDDTLCNKLLKSAEVEQEGAWRMPLGQAYDDMLKSGVADMKNVGGRPAGSITAAQFLARFVQDKTAWAHIDIAGVALVSRDLPMSPKGVTGWGVMTLNRLIADHYE
ncbi:leucyl aminopeptidase [Pseudoprimorskyibacter insulae]|uniref:Probable cytosol aminopeptidase n=1 Tax=Pseudoprimorskyibacter insulae TaxID=1695997 RepID=A0A2R8AVY5_9RHOB|nr:leucyl aminopeptidase [Pseudoprimorskyibacter insulae]SPF80183.1 Cytosol aminopeptidase [Pseudoprimorskyibacter insulae]